MFLMKAIQDYAIKTKDESVAFIMMNVKGTDLLKIDQKNTRKDELEKIKPIYDLLGLDMEPFKNVKYFYPYSEDYTSYTYERIETIKDRLAIGMRFSINICLRLMKIRNALIYYLPMWMILMRL